MKSMLLSFIVTATLLTYGSDVARSQIIATTKGKEFYLVSMANLGGSAGIDPNQYFRIFIASDSATIGTVEAPAIGFSQVFFVGANSVTAVTVPAAIELLSSEKVEKKSIHVTAGKPVAVCAISNKTYSADAYLAYPVPTLGMDYYTLCYPSSILNNLPGQETAGQFAVVATQDSTTVTITPAAGTLFSQFSTFDILLPKKGDVYQVQGDPLDTLNDLTGSHITSDKPVAAFSGHRRSRIQPSTVSKYYTSRDHIIEQLPPVQSWGTKIPFALAKLRVDIFPPRDTIDYIVRIVAAYDNTVVTINGLTVATLAAGGFYEWPTREPGIIEGSNPILAGLYCPSFNTSVIQQGNVGDPFLATLVPAEQYLDAYTFAIIQGADYTENYVTISVPNDSPFAITLDGNLVPASSFRTIGTSSFSQATIPLTQGNHTMTGTTGFGIVTYAFGAAVSYAFTGGTGVKIIPPRPVVPSYTLCAHAEALTGKTPGEIADIRVVIDSAKNISKADSLDVTIHYDRNLIRIVGVPTIAFGRIVSYVNDELTGTLSFSLVIDSLPLASQTLVATFPAQALLSWYKESTIDVTSSHIEQGQKILTTARCSMPFVLGEECIMTPTLRERGTARITSIYPNPSSTDATLILAIAGRAMDCRIEIIDMLGRRVSSMSYNELSPGSHSLTLPVRKLPGGVYSVCVHADNLTMVRQIAIE